MPLSNVERQRRFRQRQKEKVAELAKLPPWVKPLVDQIAQERRWAASEQQIEDDDVLSTEDADELVYYLDQAAFRFFSRRAKRIAGEKKLASIRKKKGARRA